MYIGVDTHKKAHTLLASDEQGRNHRIQTISNTPEGCVVALRQRREWGERAVWGIDNSGSLGKGLAQFLVSQGESLVYEVSPQRTAQYRRRGRTQDKTDKADALAIARLLEAESDALPAVRADDASTELRILSDHRDNLLVERTRIINQLYAQMLQIDPVYRDRSRPLTSRRGRGGRCPADRGAGEFPTHPLGGELAALAGIAPMEESSGGRGGFGLNRGGNRQLNRAIHIIALSQRRCDTRAKAYYEKKLPEGKTKRAAMCCLKR